VYSITNEVFVKRSAIKMEKSTYLHCAPHLPRPKVRGIQEISDWAQCWIPRTFGRGT